MRRPLWPPYSVTTGVWLVVAVMLGTHLLAQRIEARSDETPKAAQSEGREPDGEAGAPNPSVSPSKEGYSV